MYDIVKKWLLNEVGCSEALHEQDARFPVKPADRKYIPDVIGRLERDDGYVEFIGVEVKNRVSDDPKFFTQASASQAFCRRTYLALPKKLFDEADTTTQDQIRNRATKSNVGLLLVLKTRVEKLLPAPALGFDPKWFEKAEEFFQQHREPLRYYECEEWEDTQREEFREKLENYVFYGPWEVPELDDGDIVSYTMEGIECRITLDENDITIVTQLDTAASEVLETLLTHPFVMALDTFYKTFERAPRKWESLGLEESPVCRFTLLFDKSTLKVEFSKSDFPRMLFNVGVLLVRTLMGEEEEIWEPAEADCELWVEIETSLSRAAWLEKAQKNEASAMEALRTVVERSREILEEIAEE